MKVLGFISSLFKTRWVVCILPFLVGACDMTNNMDLQKTIDKMNSVEGCFTCQLFRIVFNTGAELSNAAYPKMCDIALALLAIGLFGWTLLHVFGLITTMREPNIAQFWVQFFQKMFKGGFIAIIISTRERLYVFVNELLEAVALIFISLSRTLLQTNWVSRLPLTDSIQTSFSSGPGFPAQIGSQLENLIYRVTVALNVGFVLGLRLMLQSDFTNFWLGLITVCIFFLMTLFFPFYLVDGMIRLSLVSLLLPLFLVSWVFKSTAYLLSKAWAMFLGAFAQVMVACVFVAICIATLEGFISIRGYGILLSPTAQDIDRVIKAEANRMSLSFLTFILIAFYMYKLSKRITRITSYFSGAPTTSIMMGAFERIKAALKTAVWAGVAITAAAFGLGGVSAAAAKNAKENTSRALSSKGGE